MINTTKGEVDQGYQALYVALEARYGAAVAQDLIEQIKKAGDQDNVPDYMTVKAVSEVLEAFKAEIEETIEKLKAVRSKDLPSGIADMEEKRLEQNLGRYWACYRLLYKGFHRLYERAMKTWEVPDNYRYSRQTKPTKMVA